MDSSNRSLNEYPYLQFPSEWLVKVIPNENADARFLVRLPEMSERISVYLDFDNKLGYYDEGEPYWEVYPNIDRDVSRFAKDNTKGLINEIQDILNDWKDNNKHLTTPLGKALNGDNNE